MCAAQYPGLFKGDYTVLAETNGRSPMSAMRTTAEDVRLRITFDVEVIPARFDGYFAAINRVGVLWVLSNDYEGVAQQCLEWLYRETLITGLGSVEKAVSIKFIPPQNLAAARRRSPARCADLVGGDRGGCHGRALTAYAVACCPALSSAEGSSGAASRPGLRRVRRFSRNLR